jgi:hypothetical protein
LDGELDKEEDSDGETMKKRTVLVLMMAAVSVTTVSLRTEFMTPSVQEIHSVPVMVFVRWIGFDFGIGRMIQLLGGK